MDKRPLSEPTEKPWRPADHPRPGPSWQPPTDQRSEHRGVLDAED
jgi:hypothetical protein